MNDPDRTEPTAPAEPTEPSAASSGPPPGAPGPPPLDPRPMTDARPPLPPPGLTPAAFAAPAPARRGGGWLVAALLLAVLLGISLLLNLALAGASLSELAAAGGEEVLQSGDAGARIVVVPVQGGIDDAMADYFVGTLGRLAANPPRAVVLRVDSGGGGVAASDRMWNAVRQFQLKHTDVPVVASFGSVAASGGYYIAASSRYIVCERTGITGSIGVIAQVPALETLARRGGVEINTVVADGSPAKSVANNLFENWRDDDGTLTDAGRQSRAVLKRLTNSAWERFVEVVDEGRTKLSRDQVEALATGAVYTAPEAEASGLIDQVGYLGQAIDKAAELANIGSAVTPHVTRVRRDGGLLGLLGAGSGVTGRDGAEAAGWPADLSPDRVRTWLEDLGQARLSYRMQLR